MNPSDKQNLIDVACGTGDIAKLLQKVNKSANVTCVDPNKSMINEAQKLVEYKNLNWIISPAEELLCLIIYLIFILLALDYEILKILINLIKEAYRVLKPGGKILMPRIFQNSKFWSGINL